MQLAKLIKTASTEANTLAGISTILLLIKILAFNRFSAIFTGAHELGIIVEATLASVIASYIFYLLVVHVKEQSDRAILQPYIERHAKRIVGDCFSQLIELSKASSTPLALPNISQTNIDSAFSKIAPYSQAPLLISHSSDQYANWFQYFTYHKSRTKSSIRKLLDQLIFLDAELVSLITAIDDCSHFTRMELMQDIRVKNSDLTSWASSFYKYCDLCIQPNSYLIKCGYSSIIS
jgi:hypothetical protein